MTFWAFLVGFVALLISAMVGYGVGMADGLKHGFEEGVEAERLKHIDKLEPRWRVENQKMTDEQVMNALALCSSEHLGCEDGCPYVGVACLGGDGLLKDALALINSQKAEIEELTTLCDMQDKNMLEQKEVIEKRQSEYETLRKSACDWMYKCKELQAEIDRLQKANESFSCLGKLYSEIKSEAKKEVADSLQSILDEHTLQNGDVHFVALYKAVEKFTKELVGESNV